MPTASKLHAVQLSRPIEIKQGRYAQYSGAPVTNLPNFLALALMALNKPGKSLNHQPQLL